MSDSRSYRRWVLLDKKNPAPDSSSKEDAGLLPIAKIVTPLSDCEDEELHVPRGHARVRLHAAAMNHRDLWIRKRLYPGIIFDSVLGADGAGVVDSVADSEDSHLKGASVLINSAVGWGDDQSAPDPTFMMLGLKPLPGTFGDYIVVPVQQLYQIPSHLTFEQAAALPLAGLTAYRATITKAEVKRGKKVLITGIGGGVALFALQFAVALGAEVYVSSSSQEKINRAIALGAKGGVDYTQNGWSNKLIQLAGGRLDAVVDGAGGPAMNDYLKVVRPGGIISQYGATAGLCNGFNLHALFLKQIELRGSTMGSDAEFRDMMELVKTSRLVPIIDVVLPFDELPRGFERMAKHDQFGKIVLSINEKVSSAL